MIAVAVLMTSCSADEPDPVVITVDVTTEQGTNPSDTTSTNPSDTTSTNPSDTTGTTTGETTTHTTISVSVKYLGALRGTGNFQGTTCIGDTIWQFFHGGSYSLYRLSDLSLITSGQADLAGNGTPHCWIANHYITEYNDTIVMFAAISGCRYFVYKKHGTQLEFLKVFSHYPEGQKYPSYFVTPDGSTLYAQGWGSGTLLIYEYPVFDDLLSEFGDAKNMFTVPSYIETIQDVFLYDNTLYISYGTTSTSDLGYERIDLITHTAVNVSLRPAITAEPEGFFEHDGIFYMVVAGGGVYRIEETVQQTTK